jgi:hypothetical protein
MRFFLVISILPILILKTYAQPSIQSFSPTSAKQGETVTIVGDNFLDVSGVYFDAIPALSYEVVNSNQIRAKVPGGGTGAIKVWTKDGSALKYGFFHSGATKLYWLSNTWGLPPVMTFSGTGLNNIQTVKIGNQSLLAAYFSGAFIINLPNPVRGDLVIETPSGSIIHPFIGHTFVHYVDYLSGLPGDTILVDGYNLNLVSDAFIGSYKLTKLDFPNVPNQLRFIIPDAPLNFSAPLTFITTYQVVQSFNFSIKPSPRIHAFFPRNAIAGDSISVSGKGLGNVTQVKIGGAISPFTVISDTELRVLVGGNALSGDISVSTPTGKGSKSGFTRDPITITNVSPDPVGYGDIFSISGPAFGKVKEVLFGSNPQKSLPFTQTYPGQIQVPIWEDIQPPLIIRNEYESSAPFSNFSFIRKPYIDSIVPAKAKPGEQITLFVKNVTNPTSISFSGEPGKILSFDGSRIIATVGNGSRGVVTIICNEGWVYYSKFTVVKKPVISNFRPATGGFGDTITIMGQEFDLVNKVYLGNVPLDTFWFSRSLDTIKAVLRGNLTQGEFNLSVKDRGDSTVSYNEFKFFFPPILYNDVVKIGSEGSLVQLKGKNLFGYVHYTKVLFNNVVSPKLLPQSDSILYAEVPEGIQPNEIKVKTAFGQSQSVPFVYKAPPVIDTLFPTFAKAGETVTVKGKNFTNLPGFKLRLFINSVNVTPQLIGDDEVRFIMPENASSGRVVIQTNGYAIESRHMVERKFNGAEEISLKQFYKYTIRKNETYQIEMKFADLDGDSKPEWIRISHDANYRYTLTWQKNISDLYHFKFGPEVTLFDSVANCCLSLSLETADFNNDGKTDILMTIGPNAGTTGMSTNLKIFYNKFTSGQPTFSKVEDREFDRYLSPVISDLDKDGFPDITYFYCCSPGYWWFPYISHDEKPFFQRGRQFLGSININFNYGFPGPVVVEYINADPRPDLFMPYVSYNLSTPEKKPYKLGYKPINTYINIIDFDSHLRDLNGDGLVDVVRFMSPNSIHIYTNTGNTDTNDGLFEQAKSFPVSVSPYFIKANDFNGDAKIDFMFFGSNLYEKKSNADSIYFFKRTGTSGEFNFEGRGEPTDFMVYTSEVFTGDYNADGRPDLLLLQDGNSSGIGFKEIVFLINGNGGNLYSSGCFSGPRTLTTLGTGVRYQWQIFENGTFVNISETAPFSGTTSKTLNIGSISESILHSKFRCLIDNVPTPEYSIRVRNEFSGAANGNRLWSDPTNWSCGNIPDLNTDAILDGVEVIIDQPAACRQLNLRNGAKIFLQNESTLNIKD